MCRFLAYTWFLLVVSSKYLPNSLFTWFLLKALYFILILLLYQASKPWSTIRHELRHRIDESWLLQLFFKTLRINNSNSPNDFQQEQGWVLFHGTNIVNSNQIYRLNWIRNFLEMHLDCPLSFRREKPLMDVRTSTLQFTDNPNKNVRITSFVWGNGVEFNTCVIQYVGCHLELYAQCRHLLT